MANYREYHEENGGMVIEDKEFSKYKEMLEILYAEDLFYRQFKDMCAGGIARYSTEDFARYYRIR